MTNSSTLHFTYCQSFHADDRKCTPCDKMEPHSCAFKDSERRAFIKQQEVEQTKEFIGCKWLNDKIVQALKDKFMYESGYGKYTPEPKKGVQLIAWLTQVLRIKDEQKQSAIQPLQSRIEELEKENKQSRKTFRYLR